MEFNEESLCKRVHIGKTSSYQRWAPKQLTSFSEFAKTTFSAQKLSNKEKELIAIGCAHTLRCSYCIDYHVDLAIKSSATDKEIAEASWVGIFIASHSVHEFFSSNAKSLGLRKESNPIRRSSEEKFQQLNSACLDDGALTHSFKLLIAIGSAQSILSFPSTKKFVDSALKMKIEEEAIEEAIWVAIEMAGGASFGYSGLTAELLERMP